MSDAVPVASGREVALAPAAAKEAAPGVTLPGPDLRWRDVPRRSLGAVATIVLIVVSLATMFLTVWSRPEGVDFLRSARFVVGATPAASPESCTGDCPGASVAFQYTQPVGSGFINKPDLSDDDLAANAVQLQDWKVLPGATIAIPAGANGISHGAVADVILDGAGAMTIDGPAVLTRADNSVTYLEAGTMVELGRGDMITYAAGKARTLHNPLATRLLSMKSAIFYVAGSTPPRVGLPSDNLRVRIDGNGVLPKPLKDYPNNEVGVALEYAQIDPSLPLPIERWSRTRIIGPVDPQAGPAETEGYFLWVSEVLA